MQRSDRNSSLEITWPLHDEQPVRPLPTDRSEAVSAFAPASADLQALQQRTDIPDGNEQGGAPEAERQRRLRESLPPDAPEWMQAARALADSLEAVIARGQVDPIEHAGIARAWAAWSLGGVGAQQIFKVVHVVSRAHTAIRETPRSNTDMQMAYSDCATVLYQSLPRALRQRMPFERVLLVVRDLRQEADHSAAVVEGAAELLGWKDYARMHAASVIRAVVESSR